MQKRIVFALLLFPVINSFAQIKFENGYIISNGGVRINCLIKNLGWKNSPEEISYKLSESAEVQKAAVADMQEFGITNISKYKRYELNIDQSSEQIDKLSRVKDPEYERMEVLLKVLVEGKASLYAFEKTNLIKFFLSKDSAQPEPLVYKTYEVSNQSVATNNYFRNQLWNGLKCDKINMQDIERLTYREGDLVKIVERYNACENGTSANFIKNEKKDLFSLSIRPGANLSAFKVKNSNSREGETNFGQKLNLRVGVEAEFLLSFNNKKWGIVVEPVYESYKSSALINSKAIDVKYQAVQLTAGVRHYFFLNEYAKLYLSGLFIYDSPFNSYMTTTDYRREKMSSTLSYALSGGLNVKRKFTVEIRYEFPRNPLNEFAFYNSKLTTIGFVLGYTIF